MPDGTVVAPGATFTKTWTVRNNGGGEDGAGAWPEDTALLHVGGDMELRPAAARVPVGAVVAGDERQLSVELTAPSGDGRYWSYWRLVSGDGPSPLRFGPRLWADVSVKTKAATETEKIDVDALLHGPIEEAPRGNAGEDEAQHEEAQNTTAAPAAVEPTAPSMLGTALTSEQEEPTAPEKEEEPAEKDVLGGRWEAAVAMLTAMGYKKAEFQDSLMRNGGDMQAVLEELLG